MASRHAIQEGVDTRVLEVWDLPLRLFHWSLVVAVALAIASAKVGGEWIVWHGRLGLLIVGLVTFRVVWGLVGSTHARFVNFLPTPGRIHAYLAGSWHGLGHNPLGAFSVFALLGVLAFQGGSGLVSNDDISFTGPLASLVSEEFSLKLTGWHHQVGNILLALIGLHVLAIVFYRLVKRENLVKPMFTGIKQVRGHLQGAPAVVKARPVALLVSLALAGVSVWAANGGLIKPDAPTAPAPSLGSGAAPASPGSAASQSAPAW